MFVDRLKEARAKQNLSQRELASKLFISQQAYAKYEVGTSSPNPDMLQKIGKILNVSVDYLIGGNRILKKGFRIPVLGSVQAGIPIEAVEDFVDFEEIDVDMASHGEYFGLVVKGDSMEPKFSPKDVVIVRLQPTVENGDIGIFLINGEDATIKKFNRHSDGSINLIPLNNAYEVLHYSAEEVLELPVTCLGKVIELRAKF